MSDDRISLPFTWWCSIRFRWAAEGHCLELGDFNAPFGSTSLAAYRFSRKLLEVVCELARHQHKMGSVLDLIFSPRASDVFRMGVLTQVGTSGHATVSMHWWRGIAVSVGAWRLAYSP